jgi:uncharacterized Zn-binding protein involved in type VI secretion
MSQQVCPKLTGPIPHVGGPVMPPGASTVMVGGNPAAVKDDQAICVGPPAKVSAGAPTTQFGGKMVARMGDPTDHGGVIVVGMPTVLA